MKKRGRWTHDPNYGLKKYDKMGNINPLWKAAYPLQAKIKIVVKRRSGYRK